MGAAMPSLGRLGSPLQVPGVGPSAGPPSSRSSGRPPLSKVELTYQVRSTAVPGPASWTKRAASPSL